MNKIKVYIPNLENRQDRRASIIKQFNKKNIFEINIIRPTYDRYAHKSLWKTFYDIVKKESQLNSDFFIFCEDDHVFTKFYNDSFLLEQIKIAEYLGADILSGGMSWFEAPLQVRDNIFWVDKFNGMQFTVVFNKFYHSILSSKRDNDFITDIHISALSDYKFVLYPYISIQKEFGYSDVTPQNNKAGYVRGMFKKSENKLYILNKVSKYYDKSFV